LRAGPGQETSMRTESQIQNGPREARNRCPLLAGFRVEQTNRPIDGAHDERVAARIPVPRNHRARSFTLDRSYHATAGCVVNRHRLTRDSKRDLRAVLAEGMDRRREVRGGTREDSQSTYDLAGFDIAKSGNWLDAGGE